MRVRRVVLAGVLLASAVALGALLLKLLAIAIVVVGTMAVAAGVLIFFNERRHKASQFGSTGPTPEQRVEQVLALNSTVREWAGRVRSTQLREALLRGCEVVPEIMAYTQQRDRDNLATTAAQIGVYLQSVDTALQQYVTMQDNPKRDTPRMLHEDAKVLGQFPEFVLKSRTQLEAGDLAVYRANLRVLQPMSNRGIKG